MKPKKTPNEWSKTAILNKAQRYAETMQDRESWQYVFWSALTLEMLLRASISNISPALLAEKDWSSVYFALGYARPKKLKSLSVTELLNQAAVMLPGFNSDMSSFSVTHFERRNSDVHSGALPFDGLLTSEWLPQFYSVSECLLKSMNKPLSFLYGTEEATAAKIMINGLKSKAAKAVKKTIAHKQKDWDRLPKADRDALTKQAVLLATRNKGHIVTCPACKSKSIVKGTPSSVPTVSVADDLVIVKTPMLPIHFECTACKLKILGYAKLSACGLGGVYTSTAFFDAIEYYGKPTEEEYYMEEDNNDP